MPKVKKPQLQKPRLSKRVKNVKVQKPRFSREEIYAFWEELSLKPTPYKRILCHQTPDKEPAFTDFVIEHGRGRKRVGSKRCRPVPLTHPTTGEVCKDADGQPIIIQHTEVWDSPLRSAGGSSSLRGLDLSWTVAILVDAEKSVARTGSPADGLEPYISEITSREQSAPLKEIAPRGRPPKKTNSAAILDDYAHLGPETAAWVREHADELNADTSWSHDGYEGDPALSKADSLDALDHRGEVVLSDRVNCGRRVKPKLTQDEYRYGRRANQKLRDG